MSTAHDEPTQVVRRIVLRAASGRQYEALGELLDLTGSDDPRIAWPAAAAALPGMYWEGSASEASDLVARIVERFGAVAGQYQLSPAVRFDLAVAAGTLYDGSDGVPRLLEMAAHLPEADGLRDRLLWAAGHMAECGPAALMPLCLGDPQELRPVETALLQRNPAELTADEVSRVWKHAGARSRPDVLVQLHDAGLPMPADAPVWYALAESLLRAGRPQEAEQIMLGARVVWYPLAVWDTLPITPVLHPGLRPLITAAVREAYFTLPVGEMVPR